MLPDMKDIYFHNIVGHDAQIESLIKALGDNRVSHSYIFSGPSGVGKKLIARDYAKLLNCSRAVHSAGDHAITECECKSCKKIDRGTHPDVVIVESHENTVIKVDQVRTEIEQNLYLKPFEGRFKVVIVDECERMNPNAQNAFLKTLEEPPPSSVIILITSKPQTLLPTITSRCNTIRFSALSTAGISRIIPAEWGLAQDELSVLVRLFGGSAGDILRWGKGILEFRADLIMGIERIEPNSPGDLFGLVESLPIGKGAEENERLKIVIRMLLLWLADVARLKIDPDNVLEHNPDILSVSKRYADKNDLNTLINLQAKLEKAEYDIFLGYANKQLTLESVLCDLTM